MKLSRRSVLTLPVATALVGCGPVQPTNSMTLSVAQNSSALSYFVPFVAQQHQFFEAQGLRLDPSRIPVMGNGAKTAPGIEAGSIEAAFGTLTDAFTLSRVDAYIKLVGAFCTEFTIDLIVSKQFLAETRLTAHSPLADKVRALVGRKVGISSPSTATEGLLIYLLKQFGYDYKRDVTEILLGNVNPVSAIAALTAGRADAVSQPIPAGQIAQAQGIGEIFISLTRGDIPTLRGMLYGVIYTRQHVIDAKPKAVAALIRAIAQAEEFIQNNPKQATTLLRAFLKLDEKETGIVAQAALSSMPRSPQIDQRAYTVANQFHVDAGLIAVPLAYHDLVAENTISQALAPLRR